MYKDQSDQEILLMSCIYKDYSDSFEVHEILYVDNGRIYYQEGEYIEDLGIATEANMESAYSKVDKWRARNEDEDK